MITFTLILLYGLIFEFRYNNIRDKLFDFRYSEYNRHMSSYRAGGSGMIINSEGNIDNASSAERCLESAVKVISVSDETIGKKAMWFTFKNSLLFLMLIFIVAGLEIYFLFFN